MAQRHKLNYIDLMLDSGVFSAWNRNKEINFDEYISYVKDNKEYLFSYVNMDVIPGKYGQKRTQKEVDDSASGSYSNLQKMKEHGLSPIPVFHQGESPKWLERMLNDGETYIGISSAKDVPVKEQKRWLDEMFCILTDSKGVPFVRTHGFGIMSVSILLRYPFFTVDSTSWALGGGYGKILVPTFKNGKYDYTKKPVPVIISGEVNSSKSAQKMQFDWKGSLEQDVIRKYVEEVCKVSMVDVRCDPSARHICWLKYYLELCKHIVGKKFQHKQALQVKVTLGWLLTSVI